MCGVDLFGIQRLWVSSHKSPRGTEENHKIFSKIDLCQIHNPKEYEAGVITTTQHCKSRILYRNCLTKIIFLSVLSELSN
jgi:hypothetical protein